MISSKPFNFKLPSSKPFKFPKPISKIILAGSKRLIKIPFVLLRIISLFLDADSYLAFIGTCTDIRKLGDDETLPSNHARDIVRILSLIFDLKRNVFITGSAGCAKTYTLNKIYDWAIKLGVCTVMTATTGIASINLKDGRTLHSFSGLRKGTIPLNKLEEKLEANEFRIPKLLKEAELLMCDEISMIGARFLSKFNMVGQYARNSNSPLGGLQVVLAGDYCQLPPVADKYAFSSPIWKELDLVPVVLRFPFRQSQDMKYYKFLQRIRVGQPTEEDYQFLESRYAYTIEILKTIEGWDIKPTRLMSKQAAVKKYNIDQFEKLNSPIERDYPADDEVVERVIIGKKAVYNISTSISLEQARKELKGRAEHQAPEHIQFRDGAQYILTFNIDIKKKHVNGSKCVYREGGIVEFLDGSQMKLEQCMHNFYYPIGSNLFLSRKQVALRLGYGSTVHSSQGCTLEMIMIDLGPSIFCASQSYVALSRVKTSQGLFINNFVRKSIKTNKEAQKFTEDLD